jgi:hypothetical protein
LLISEFKLQSPLRRYRTVIRRSTGAEKVTPFVLADTLTVVVPRGQVSVDPGPVPQPPVHANRV